MLPLQGIRVVDLSSVVMGPYASQWLGDFGAEVIKVEPPSGDSTRRTGPATELGMAALFLGVNRNKKSVVLDIKTPAGRDELQSLIATADVFMHNIRPQKLARLGLDAQTLRGNYPRLVYAGLHGFGEDGVYAGRPAYDDVVQGLSGAVALMQAKTGDAQYFPAVAADKTSGLIAALSILAALLKRERVGQGSYVEIPMFESMVAFNLVEHLYGRHFEPSLGAAGYPRVLAPARKPYATIDGFVCLMPYTDAQWAAFFRATGNDDLATDRRFTSIAARTAHIELLYETTAGIVEEEATAYWLALCETLEIPAAAVHSLASLEDDEHLRSCGFFQMVQDGRNGTLRFPGVPVKFDGERPGISCPPRLGEHNTSLFGRRGPELSRGIDEALHAIQQANQETP
ncbi:CaiB/BaiF CoA transferase family protein [Cupriavidus malaysiensis]|uniref:CoA transferase n=1 Tax=Cupriavidus malaysiensis TaxID=367825 RepID=A0ABM6FGU1_9BURK|nr:CoA transferase [Cupriavidus malaysiensis]AOZ11173.1 CoA transferase [Cupriavidus malaysiensis]